jgi:hypothetical protein
VPGGIGPLFPGTILPAGPQRMRAGGARDGSLLPHPQRLRPPMTPVSSPSHPMTPPTIPLAWERSRPPSRVVWTAWHPKQGRQRQGPRGRYAHDPLKGCARGADTEAKSAVSGGMGSLGALETSWHPSPPSPPSPTQEDGKGESVTTGIPPPTTLWTETPSPRLLPCQDTQGDHGGVSVGHWGVPSDDASRHA